MNICKKILPSTFFISIILATGSSLAITGTPFWIRIDNKTSLLFSFKIESGDTWDRGNFPLTLKVKPNTKSKQYKTEIKKPFSDIVTLNLKVTVDGKSKTCKFTTNSQHQQLRSICKVKDSSENEYTMKPSGVNTNLLFTVTPDK